MSPETSFDPAILMRVIRDSWDPRLKKKLGTSRFIISNLFEAQLDRFY